MLPEGEDATAIIRMQNNLFNVCTHLATDQSRRRSIPLPSWLRARWLSWNSRSMRIMAFLPERQGFILPGGCQAAAQCHVARTVCRRAERRIAALAEVATVGEEMQQYVNRLSDYLFVLAKKINFNNVMSMKLYGKMLVNRKIMITFAA